MRKVLDLGCGPGNISRYLAEAFPNAQIHGVDSSHHMIETARKTFTEPNYPALRNRLSFELASIDDFLQNTANHSQYDIIFSNAVLHWLPNHLDLLPEIAFKLINKDRRGVLAVQMPYTKDQPSHVLMETAALRTGMIKKIIGVRIPRAEQSPASFYQKLSPLCEDINIWTTEYVTQLKTVRHQQFHPVVEFTKATGLMPILEAVGGEDSEDGRKYLAEYERLIEEAYPIIPTNSNFVHGSSVVLFPFKRIFIVSVV